ncbi:MAG: hypothetical protein SGPRY_014494, partial [Prymnesium sp.]
LAPAWGAPSLDAECTRAQTYLRMCGLSPPHDFSLHHATNPQLTPHNTLPVLQIARQGERAGEAGHDPDKSLDPSQKAESLAYISLVTERLGVALLHSWWADEENYEVLRAAYAGRLAVPLCYYLPWSIRRKARSQLARRACAEADVAYAFGEEALSALACRYADRSFFHGDQPTSVDAAAFAYLTAVYRCPLPNDQLRQAMRSHRNLVSLVERISTHFFGGSHALLSPSPPPALPPPNSGKAVGEAEEAAAAGKGSAKSSRTPKAQRFKQRSRNALVAAGVTALVYAFATDITGRQEQNEEEDE